MSDLAITRGRAADIASLQPLWVSVHHTHQEVMPELAPYVSDERTWNERAALYDSLLRRPRSFLLLAHHTGSLAGYALGYVHEANENWVADTWDVAGDIGELESLAVAPESRGQGIGTALLDAANDAFDRLGVRDVVIGVLPGNSGARRLYERHGYRPTWMYLSRFEGR